MRALGRPTFELLYKRSLFAGGEMAGALSLQTLGYSVQPWVELGGPGACTLAGHAWRGTKRFFMAGTEKVLITFSAGVAQLAQGEEAHDAIRRADQAMYLAKRAGKNRVIGA